MSSLVMRRVGVLLGVSLAGVLHLGTSRMTSKARPFFLGLFVSVS
jgi:hypothetical protein